MKSDNMKALLCCFAPFLYFPILILVFGGCGNSPTDSSDREVPEPAFWVFMPPTGEVDQRIDMDFNDDGLREIVFTYVEMIPAGINLDGSRKFKMQYGIKILTYDDLLKKWGAIYRSINLPYALKIETFSRTDRIVLVTEVFSDTSLAWSAISFNTESGIWLKNRDEKLNEALQEHDYTNYTFDRQTIVVSRQQVVETLFGFENSTSERVEVEVVYSISENGIRVESLKKN